MQKSNWLTDSLEKRKKIKRKLNVTTKKIQALNRLTKLNLLERKPSHKMDKSKSSIDESSDEYGENSVNLTEKVAYNMDEIVFFKEKDYKLKLNNFGRAAKIANACSSKACLIS